MVQIQRKLSGAIAKKFMAPARNVAHVFQHDGSPEVIESLPEPFGSEGSVPSD
jgi:hypothetical protein